MDSPPAVRPHQRERSRSSFSFRSDHSGGRKSSGSRPKIDLSENDGDRSKVRFSAQAMANPNRAINEDEPSSRAHNEQATIASIRGIDWKDAYGNSITDPDASNPSRSRMERPLDTIRSFEAAIYKGERRRTTPRVEPPNNFESHTTSRRSSLVLNDPSLNARSPYSRQRSSQYPVENYPSPQPGYGPRPPVHRHSSAPMAGYGSRLNPEHPSNVYPSHSYRESHETVTTGESHGSTGTEPWANSTDPSSESSSIDRIHAANLKIETPDAYGNYSGGSHNNYNHNYHHQGSPSGRSPGGGQDPRYYYQQQQQQQQQYPQYQQQQQPSSPYRNPQYRPDQPPVPEHQMSGSNIIKLGGDAPPPPPKHTAAAWEQQPAKQPHQPRRPGTLQKQPTEKRKSWLKRRFSKG